MVGPAVLVVTPGRVTVVRAGRPAPAAPAGRQVGGTALAGSLPTSRR